jgi:hypothetical protein
MDSDIDVVLASHDFPQPGHETVDSKLRSGDGMAKRYF